MVTSLKDSIILFFHLHFLFSESVNIFGGFVLWFDKGLIGRIRSLFPLRPGRKLCLNMIH